MQKIKQQIMQNREFVETYEKLGMNMSHTELHDFKKIWPTKSTYEKMRKKKEQRIDAIYEKYVFFAPTKRIYKEGLKKLGLKWWQKKAVAPLYPDCNNAASPYYILKNKRKYWERTIQGFNVAREKLLQDPEVGFDFAYDMFLMELIRYRDRDAHKCSFISYRDAHRMLQSIGYNYDEVDSDPVLGPALTRAEQLLNRRFGHACNSKLQYYYSIGGKDEAFGIFNGTVTDVHPSKGYYFSRLDFQFPDYFNRLYINDVYPGNQKYGETMKESVENIWICDAQAFMDVGLKPGDNVQFSALAYAYYRKDGFEDYSLKNPQNISILH